MSRIIELIVALVILVIAILSEWKVNTMNLIKSDFNNRVWLLGLIALVLFSSILVLNKKHCVIFLSAIIIWLPIVK